MTVTSVGALALELADKSQKNRPPKIRRSAARPKIRRFIITPAPPAARVRYIRPRIIAFAVEHRAICGHIK